MAKIAVALSGGGYRASIFSLGVLLYLVDANKNKDVTSISSVSGGSITNAYLAQLKGYQEHESSTFWNKVQPLAQTIANKTLWSTPLTWVYILFLLVTFLAIVCVSFFGNSWNWGSRFLLFGTLLVPWGFIFQQRGTVAGRSFGTNLYSPSGKPTKLYDIEQSIDHVFCSTHLNEGEHFYFSGRFVYSYRFGWGKPGGLPLHVAVQASAAFPGGFPPRWIRTKHFDFVDGKNRPGPLPWVVTLTDGGVYDNMADQWSSGVVTRAGAKPKLNLKIPDQLIVVNASAGLTWSLLNTLKIPLIGEFLSLLRVISVMFDNSSSLRMQALVEQFKSSQGLQGALLTITQNPFSIPRAFEHGSSPAAARASHVIEQLDPHSETEWKRIAKENSSVKTTLNKLGPDVSARLMRHGYALAMANLHVILNFPILDIPDIAQFKKLAS